MRWTLHHTFQSSEVSHPLTFQVLRDAGGKLHVSESLQLVSCFSPHKLQSDQMPVAWDSVLTAVVLIRFLLSPIAAVHPGEKVLIGITEFNGIYSH